jgi:hypothetical protein
MKKEEVLEFIKANFNQAEIEELIKGLPRAEEITIKEYNHSCESDEFHVFYDPTEARDFFNELVEEYEENGDACYLEMEGQGLSDSFEQ